MQFQQASKHILERLKRDLPSHLSYHTLEHVLDVYAAASRIAEAEGVEGTDLALLLTAVLFHDSGFMIQSKNHEKFGCEIARETLPRFDYSAAQIDAICQMIFATEIPQQPKNLLEEIMADADLDYLGRDDFYTIGQTLFKEFKDSGVIETEQEWNRLQIKFLEQHHYFTATSIASRAAQKAQHLAELKQLFNA
ncbi:MAG: HD domain-containing protein [Chitinophagaceae bacterium]